MLPLSKLDDGLDDDSLLDEKGYPAEMNPAERESIEDSKYEERLQLAVLETRAFLALVGSL